MTEPLSLLPITRLKPTKALFLGDPLQLPPTITTPSQTPSLSLDRTLFERLAESGHTVPIMLRTQYRCHPDIANISNGLFYSGALVHGCSPRRVSPLQDSLDPVVFIDVGQGVEEGSGSVMNRSEADAVCAIVKTLVELGVPVSGIGVITFCNSWFFLYF
jgi:superfamily I DNA and/or RNA helicase